MRECSRDMRASARLRRAFNKDKVTPRTNIMVEEFKPGRGAGGKAAAGSTHVVNIFLTEDIS